MPSLELAAGSLRVTFPDSYDVEPPPRPDAARRQDQPPDDAAWTGRVGPTSAVSSALLEAFDVQGLDLVQRVALVPVSPSPASTEGARGRQPSRPGKMQLDLDLARGQSAVVLLEQDGLFSWQLPTGHDQTPPSSRRGPGHPAVGSAVPASGAVPASRVARFEIDVRAIASARPTTHPGTALAPSGDGIIGRVTAYVLKFASRFVPGALMSLLDRRPRPGLVLMTGDEVKAWSRVDDLTEVTLPESRPARILLFVHGTFSNTAGSFGMLTATPQGRRFLESAAGSHDAVIGFDHRTLSRDPLENATDLHARLSAAHLAFPPTIDIVCYSRGGLVTRSLIEYLLPSSPWRANIGSVAFVGATNAGTLLAEPDCWNDLVDLYTNLAAGTARSIGFATGAVPRAEIVAGMVSGVGAFVKYLAWAAVTDRRIPGLAAMEPDGPFIAGINGTQSGQPVAGTPWYVVSTDFEPRLLDDRHEPPELPRELVAKLADGLVDQLMGTENDLVVDLASMGSVDLPSGGGFIKDTLSLGTNSVVYHLNYFIQPRVCDALKNWLS